MKKKVRLGGVIKEIDNEKILADYILAGWEMVQEEKTNPKSKKNNEKI